MSAGAPSPVARQACSPSSSDSRVSISDRYEIDLLNDSGLHLDAFGFLARRIVGARQQLINDGRDLIRSILFAIGQSDQNVLLPPRALQPPGDDVALDSHCFIVPSLRANVRELPPTLIRRGTQWGDPCVRGLRSMRFSDPLSTQAPSIQDPSAHTNTAVIGYVPSASLPHHPKRRSSCGADVAVRACVVAQGNCVAAGRVRAPWLLVYSRSVTGSLRGG